MRTLIRVTVIAIASMALLIVSGASSSGDGRGELLRVRESVWRAWFADDTKALQTLVPPDTIVISSGEDHWKNQADIFRTAAEFHAKGGKLTRLEFPRTEIQRYGDVAIIYSQYLVETEEDSKRSLSAGRVTEVFVLRHGQWTNPGWHTDSEK